MFKDCGTIARKTHCIQRFSIAHNQKLEQYNCPDCGREHKPWKNRNSVANHKIKVQTVLICARRHRAQPEDMSFPFALFCIEWPDTPETWMMYESTQHMAKIAKESSEKRTQGRHASGSTS